MTLVTLIGLKTLVALVTLPLMRPQFETEDRIPLAL
jgi:hypothetical protein